MAIVCLFVIALIDYRINHSIRLLRTACASPLNPRLRLFSCLWGGSEAQYKKLLTNGASVFDFGWSPAICAKRIWYRCTHAYKFHSPVTCIPPKRFFPGVKTNWSLDFGRTVPLNIFVQNLPQDQDEEPRRHAIYWKEFSTSINQKTEWRSGTLSSIALEEKRPAAWNP